jgi:hypothetical protein
LQYYTNITLGKRQFSVSIDTGRHVVLFVSLFYTFEFSPLTTVVPTCGLRITFSIRRILVSLPAFNMPSVAFLAI